MQIQPGQRALVMGLAKSGEAVAKLLLDHGLEVIVNDWRERGETEYEAEQLAARGATVVFGGHPLGLLDERPDFIVKNPGIQYSVPLVVEAIARGIPVYTEIEVAVRFTSAPIFAITGSNGKTTTTTLVGEILEEAKREPVVAGNIGRVLSGVVEHVRPTQPIVLEVSSFQLLGTEEFRPKIAALLNVYPAHLDYHETFQAYYDAKWKMFDNMQTDDVAVLNFDMPLIRERAATLGASVVWFSRQAEVPVGAFVRDGQIVVRRDGVDTNVMALRAIALKGDHLLEDCLAATAISVWAGVPSEAIREVLSRFRGVEHRQEFVRTVHGVDYYNDSKATNPQAALRALRSFRGNIVWIAGGLNRGDDFGVLSDDIRDRVRAAVLLGQSADAIESVCKASGVMIVEMARTIENAVQIASRLARPGDIVLLSPASASWDMFTSFEERGRMFKEAVHTL